jgi:hypothetical protein
MLPMKIELTEKVAAILRKRRLERPVNGKLLTAEKLSKSIGNNRAWMSQIENRRLKWIKREDVIKIYQLLYDESDESIAEEIAKQDLFSPFSCYDSKKNNPSSVEESYSEDIIFLDKLMSELRDVLFENYKKIDSNEAKIALFDCLQSMIKNFRNDYMHTNRIYSVPINHADPECLGEDYAKEYYDYLDTICVKYELYLCEAFTQVNIDSFLAHYQERYTELMQDINKIDINNASDHIDIVFGIELYYKLFFNYIKRVQTHKAHSANINLNDIFDLLMKMIKTLMHKLKINYSFSDTIPTFQSSKSELDEKQLEIANAIMFIIKNISNRK